MANVVLVTLMVMARLAPLAIMLPKVFSAAAPRRWGIGVCLMLAIAISPEYAADAIVADYSRGELLLALLRELVLGFALSLGFVVILSGLILGGTIVSQLSGVDLASSANPQGRAMGETSVQCYFGWLMLVVLLVSGGHRHLVAAILDSFRWVPLGAGLANVRPIPLAGEMLSQCFQSGLRVAAPISFCLIVSTLLVSVLSRTLPSLGVLGLNVSINLILLLLVTSVSLEAIATVYQQSWTEGVDHLVVSLLGPGGSK